MKHFQDMQEHLESMRKIDHFLTEVINNFEDLKLCKACLADELENFVKFLRGQNYSNSDQTEFYKEFQKQVLQKLGTYK